MGDRLSVLIPARNEQFLQKTIMCVLDAARGDVEVIAVCDGYWPDPPVLDAPSVAVLHYTNPIGQRAAINRAASIATGRYIMKLDAHCDVAPGFDVELKKECRREWTMVPRMYTLDPVTWEKNRRKRTDYMYVSSPEHEPRPFCAMYYGNWGGINGGRPKVEGNRVVDETMCCMGPGWFMWKDRFWELGGLDEGHGGWGQMGVEVSLKAWLSGGALMVNKRTWFAHWFRGGGVPPGFKSGFPYQISNRDVDRARKYSRELWLNGNWPKQVRDVKWLAEKFQAPTWDGRGVVKKDGEVNKVTHPLLSVIIPSYKDPLLHRTIQSILDNFETDFEIIPVLDGYDPAEPLPADPRVKPIRLEQNVGMRGAINAGVRASLGQYIMRADEHCMFCKGFDRIMLGKMKDNEIATAPRYFLDPIKWELMPDEGVINYEKLIVNRDPLKFSSYPWPTRDEERKEVEYDETMAMQGSMWVMARTWWEGVIGELQVEGYGPHYQDSTEMLFKTWGAGGRLMLNKGAWYAHKHRSFPRTHHYPREKAEVEWKYALSKHFQEYQEVKKKWKEQG